MVGLQISYLKNHDSKHKQADTETILLFFYLCPRRLVSYFADRFHISPCFDICLKVMLTVQHVALEAFAKSIVSKGKQLQYKHVSFLIINQGIS